MVVDGKQVMADKKLERSGNKVRISRLMAMVDWLMSAG